MCASNEVREGGFIGVKVLIPENDYGHDIDAMAACI